MPKLIKLHALNMIYDSKILNSKELEALALTRTELNKIGVNINQIARVLNTQKEAKIDTRLLKSLENLKETLTLLRNDIKMICHISQGLLK
ncbi:plasmid mobilization relaxosome protein MobC [Helicobacter bilis]|uniref:plasmid mobilization relaxosome protein MobC n=1 Tax=Helicobacter bilis TaxID=37372 RepID=UPI0018F838F1|nr:plasmid mobilization relaxosome protein MobC [Helicobacter bilis]